MVCSLAETMADLWAEPTACATADSLAVGTEQLQAVETAVRWDETQAGEKAARTAAHWVCVSAAWTVARSADMWVGATAVCWAVQSAALMAVTLGGMKASRQAVQRVGRSADWKAGC